MSRNINPQTNRLTSEQYQTIAVRFVELMSEATSIAQRNAISDQLLSEPSVNHLATQNRDSLDKNDITAMPEPSIHTPGQNRQEVPVKSGIIPKPSGSGSQPQEKLRPTNPLYNDGSSNEDSSEEEEVKFEKHIQGEGRFSKRETRCALKDSIRGRGPPKKARS